MIETLHHFGYFGIFITIVVEIGFMIFPLPGDTLLFASGILSNGKMFNFQTLLLVTFFASAIAGHIGYYVGTKIDKETLINNRFFRIKDSHLHKTEKFFEKYGTWAIVFSRFVPIVRNFISQIMGIIKYDKKKFFIANLIASIIWPLIILSLGRVFGRVFPHMIVYAEYLLIIVLLILLIPVALELISQRKLNK